jgi:integrase
MSRRNKREFPGASAYFDRHGRRRWRFRRIRFSAELGSDYGSPDFVNRYEDALAGVRSGPGAGAGKTIPRSISDLIARYYQTAEFLLLKSSTKTTYRGILERFREEHGTKSSVKLERKHIRLILATKSETPSAANNLRDRLKTLIDLAIDLDWRKDNPVIFVKPLKAPSRGFHTWSEEEIQKFYSIHKLGTVAHTAMTLMLYTGAARADAVTLGWGSITANRLRYRRQKTADNGGVLISIPIHPELRSVLDICPKGSFTFLETTGGKSRSSNGLGNKMREWCDAAGLPKCSSHGLRKAIARRMAEAGCSPHEIMAVTGHATLSEVTRYTKDANRPMLADKAITKLK